MVIVLETETIGVQQNNKWIVKLERLLQQQQLKQLSNNYLASFKQIIW